MDAAGRRHPAAAVVTWSNDPDTVVGLVAATAELHALDIVIG
ncbi:hypothetical protein ACFVGY_04125 [Streptomyces sp. NPDC127106]